jgi:hypothetical protein
MTIKRIIRASIASGALVALYGVIWGSAQTFFLAFAFAAFAWLIGDCVRDAKEAGR